MKISSFHIAKLAALACLLFGCAAQNANQEYFEADSLLKKAMTRVGSNDPDASVAFDSLSRGKLAMMDARYDAAIRHFRDSSKISREIIAGRPTGSERAAQSAHSPLASPSPSSMAQVENSAGPVSESTSNPTTQSIVRIPPVTSMDDKDGSELLRDDMPDAGQSGTLHDAPKKEAPKKDALARYLSNKKAPPPKPVPQSTPTPTVIQNEKHQETVDERPIVTNEIVVAPADSGLKPVPKVQEKSKEKQPTPEEAAPEVKAEPAPKEIGIKPKTSTANKRRVPDAVPFVSDDAAIISDAMTTLNQTAKFLMENPSTTLILQAQLSPQETRTIAEERYQSIRAYLVGKGVPEDQIQMDEVQKRGKNPEFQMYLLEH
jgi:outer membrane protein OmpA-like peptidoglycan-associated protein